MHIAFLNAMPRAETAFDGWRHFRARRIAGWVPLLVLWLLACAPPSPVRPPADLMVVTVGPEDDLEGLARRYLGAASRKWVIQDFNQIETVSEGQLVLIPRRNYRPGGLAPDGYQVVPVLAYPDLAAVKSEQVSLIVNRFRRQMQFLKAEGYHVVDVHQLIAFMSFEATLPPRAVVLTFDDQSRLFYDLIFPILKAHQFPGTLFVAPEAVGKEPMADWPQLREMMESGLNIQCRFSKDETAFYKPPNLPDRSDLEQVVSALAGDRTRIETALGQPCLYLAYPEDKAPSLMALLTEKAGYQAGFNRAGGSNAFYRNIFAIQREAVVWSEDPDSYRKHFDVFKKEALQ
ncbi:MAG: polysaccharide deacetylase family protein [Desulfosarcina sp.]|nr:polysaccharide deacetylase family protein [Desulfobacterales bacterium]